MSLVWTLLYRTTPVRRWQAWWRIVRVLPVTLDCRAKNVPLAIHTSSLLVVHLEAALHAVVMVIQHHVINQQEPVETVNIIRWVIVVTDALLVTMVMRDPEHRTIVDSARVL